MLPYEEKSNKNQAQKNKKKKAHDSLMDE